MNDDPSSDNGILQRRFKSEFINWQTLATAALFIIWAVMAMLISNWHREFSLLQEEVKELRTAQTRDEGIIYAMRQQVDINTSVLRGLLDEVRKLNIELALKIERLFATNEFLQHEFSKGRK